MRTRGSLNEPKSSRGRNFTINHAYLGVDRVHVGLGHVANDDLVVGAIEQLVVVHDSVHSLRHFFLVPSRRVAEHFGLRRKRKLFLEVGSPGGMCRAIQNAGTWYKSLKVGAISFC